MEIYCISSEVMKCSIHRTSFAAIPIRSSSRSLPKASYGYVISKNVQEITRGELQLKEATLYTTFRRLEAAGMIESYWGNENAGARRRYYHLTEKGRALFAENQADWRKYRAVISELFGMEDASR